MKLGTIAYNSEIFNLDYMDSDEVKKLLENIEKGTNDIKSTAILNKVYAYKTSNEMVNAKVKNQLNSINFSINQINPKFTDKAKNYGKISNEIIQTMSNYESTLNRLCKSYDEKLDELLYEKVEIESNLLLKMKKEDSAQQEKTSIRKKIVKTVRSTIDKIKGRIKKNEILDVGLINKLQDGQDIENEIEKSKIVDQSIIILKNKLEDVKKKIQKLNEDKENKIMNAMETNEKGLSTEIKKPRAFKKITKFFSNRFNTYNAIMKNVIFPINQRIDELQKTESINMDEEIQEVELCDFENKIKEIQNRVFDE